MKSESSPTQVLTSLLYLWGDTPLWVTFIGPQGTFHSEAPPSHRPLLSDSLRATVSGPQGMKPGASAISRALDAGDRRRSGPRWAWRQVGRMTSRLLPLSAVKQKVKKKKKVFLSDQ